MRIFKSSFTVCAVCQNTLYTCNSADASIVLSYLSYVALTGLLLHFEPGYLPFDQCRNLRVSQKFSALERIFTNSVAPAEQLVTP